MVRPIPRELTGAASGKAPPLPGRGSTTGPHLLERKLARMGVHVTRRMKGLSLTCKTSADFHKSSLLRTYPLLSCTPSCGLRCCCPSYSTSVYREGNSVMWSWRHPFQRFTPRGPDAYWSVKGGGGGYLRYLQHPREPL